MKTHIGHEKVTTIYPHVRAREPDRGECGGSFPERPGLPDTRRAGPPGLTRGSGLRVAREKAGACVGATGNGRRAMIEADSNCCPRRYTPRPVVEPTRALTASVHKHGSFRHSLRDRPRRDRAADAMGRRDDGPRQRRSRVSSGLRVRGGPASSPCSLGLLSRFARTATALALTALVMSARRWALSPPSTLPRTPRPTSRRRVRRRRRSILRGRCPSSPRS